jgi:hypothetical protein
MKLKQISSIAFGIAFLMAIVLFGHVGTEYISMQTARIVFFIAGGTALFFNLLDFNRNKDDSEGFNFLFWTGSIILFVGLIFKLMHWPFSTYILIFGLLISGVSFFMKGKLFSDKEDNEKDLIDRL